MYSGGNPVLVVEQITPVKLMINVSESYFTQVKKGGATLKFAPVLADGESSITGVTVSESGDVTVTNSYEGDPII